MLIIDATDKIEGICSVDQVVEFTFSGVDGTTLVSAEGKLGDGQTQIYDATAATRVLSITLVNTHSSVVTVNIQKDPTDAGTLYRLIPKDLSLGIGYSMHFDGQRCSVLDASGNLLTSFANLISDIAYNESTWNGVTAIAPSKNAVRDEFELRAPKASPVFTGVVTAPTIDLTGGQIAFPSTAVPSADPNTLDDYEKGTYDVTITCTTSGTVTLVAGQNLASYIKIGDSVTVHGQIVVDSVSSPVGLGTILVPFTPGVPGELAGRSAGAVIIGNMNFPTANWISTFMVENQAAFTLVESNGNSAATNIDVAVFQASSELRFGHTYIV